MSGSGADDFDVGAHRRLSGEDVQREVTDLSYAFRVPESDGERECHFHSVAS